MIYFDIVCGLVELFSMNRKFVGENIIFDTPNLVDKVGSRRKGEIIRIGSGEIGYVDWSDPDRLEGSPGTARMMRPGHVYDIEVEKGERGKGNGRQLMIALTERLVEVGYRRVVILGAIISETGFYDKILGELRQDGLVKDISREWRNNGNSRRVNYVVDLNDAISAF